MGAMPTTFHRLHRHADLAGVTASTVCLIHCLLTPVLLSFFPGVLGYLPGDALVHRILAVFILLFGLAGFVPGLRLHRRRSLLLLIGSGVVLILYVAWKDNSLSPARELLFSIPGSALLVTAHLLNRSFCRQCRACEGHSACHTTQVH